MGYIIILCYFSSSPSCIVAAWIFLVCVMPVLYGLVWSLQKHYITQLRILILGHLQNALRNENKPKCYCIFELMGYIWYSIICYILVPWWHCIWNVLFDFHLYEGRIWRTVTTTHFRIMTMRAILLLYGCANYNFNIPRVASIPSPTVFSSHRLM